MNRYTKLKSFELIDETIHLFVRVTLTFKVLQYEVNNLIVVVLRQYISLYICKYIRKDGNKHIHYNPVDHDVKREKEYWPQNTICCFKLIVTEFSQQ